MFAKTMNRLFSVALVLVVLLSFGCGISKAGVTTGLDGCTAFSVEKGSLIVTGLGSMNGEGLNYHKINEKCKGVPFHHVQPQPEQTSMIHADYAMQAKYETKHAQNFLSVKPVSCYDGDTCTFNIPYVQPILGDHIPVRLAGIDAPEIRGKCPQEKELAAKAAYHLTETLTMARRVDLLNVQRDKYFRLLANVYADEIDVNQDMLERGYAVPYFGGTKEKDWCKQA